MARVRTAAGTLRRRVPTSGAFAVLSLLGVAVLITAANVRWPDTVPLASLLLVIFLGGLLLALRPLVELLAGLVPVVLLARVLRDEDYPQFPGIVVLLIVMAAATLVLSRRRERLGVLSSRGESMLVDLRDRLRAQGVLPDLPAGWSAEAVLRGAHGDAFSGDFLVAARAPGSEVIEIALVDVSGKGVDAGTRALLLSGAFGGLLGALPPQDFLGAANAYLIRQAWPEGFATAVHLVLDLRTGRYVVSSAGHPPAALFTCGSGRWSTTGTVHGPLLGVIDGASYAGETGQLGRGDAMLLYTDGLIEIPGRDLAVGIDRLLGEAERLVPRGFRGGARRLVDAVPSAESDDRALLMIWRD